jgi:hypothetical protein
MTDKLPHPLIDHVVVLMLENRGFDHLMGSLYGPDDSPTFVGRDTAIPAFQGVFPDFIVPLPLPNNNGSLLPVLGARSPKTPSFNTGESFEHIMNQLWGVGAPAQTWLDPAKRQAFFKQLPPPVPPLTKPMAPMSGFVLDYDLETFEITGGHLDREGLSEVLDTYLPEQVPVISGLARNYAVSDEWFCSVPSQTNTNRAFAMTGTSRGLVNNSFYDPPSWNLWLQAIKKLFMKGKSHADALPISTRSLFEALEQANFSWKVFWQSEWPPKGMTAGKEWQYTRTMIQLLGDAQFDDNFVKFDASDPNNAFFAAARSGQLPAVSWIEPAWGGGPAWKPSDSWAPRGVGNDYHPVSDTTTGEDFVMSVYLALSQSPVWNKTLLVITFDENGGTYDHVPPGAMANMPLAPVDAVAASPSGTDACPLPKPPIDRGDMDPKTRTQFGFDFSQFGVRVPTLLVGPCVPPTTVFRSPGATPFDHTSLIATILTMAEIPQGDWMLGERVASAPTFDYVLASPVMREPGATLSVPMRRAPADAAPLALSTDYVFEYVGDIWHAQPGPLYLGAFGSGALGVFKYPTMTSNPASALRLQLVPSAGGDGADPLFNMSSVLFRTPEHALAATPFITINWTNAYAFYDKDKGAMSRWQVRLLGSRDPSEAIRVGDYVFFVSQAPPPVLAPGLVAPDPFQRLCSHPKNPGFATTRAGEWALWRIAPPPPPSPHT